MVEFAIPATAEAQDAEAVHGAWAAVRDEQSVAFVLPSQPKHAWSHVLLSAMAADRRRRNLENHGAPTALEPIRNLAAARVLSDKARDVLEQADPPVSPSIARMARFVFEQLGANVVEHSGRPETGYGFASIDPDRRRLELAFADAGIGFRASLQRNPELEGRVADDAEALQLALSPRMTGTSSPRTKMGFGLKTLTNFSDLLGGDLWIASGAALLQRKTTAGQRTNVLTAIPPWQGSWISLQAPVG